MKKLLFALLIVSCTHKHVPVSLEIPKKPSLEDSLPRYVYDTCTSKWAVWTHHQDQDDYTLQRDYYFGARRKGAVYVSAGRLVPLDSAHYSLGDELTFDTKQKAIDAYTSYLARVNRRNFIVDSLKNREAVVADSIRRCNHTYIYKN
jgi:hypothetical protein